MFARRTWTSWRTETSRQFPWHAQHGRVLWEEAFGWADREKKVRATTSTMYELASIAKVYTTTALMVLKERGLLDLDAPVERYTGDVKIRSFGPGASGVTLRQIIQHTSGLPMYRGAPSAADTSRPLTRADVIARYGILAFSPGEREFYSISASACSATSSKEWRCSRTLTS